MTLCIHDKTDHFEVKDIQKSKTDQVSLQSEGTTKQTAVLNWDSICSKLPGFLSKATFASRHGMRFIECQRQLRLKCCVYAPHMHSGCLCAFKIHLINSLHFQSRQDRKALVGLGFNPLLPKTLIQSTQRPSANQHLPVLEAEIHSSTHFFIFFHLKK